MVRAVDPIELRGDGGERVYVGTYPDGRYWVEIYERGDRIPFLSEDFPSVEQVIEATQGQVSWTRYSAVIRQLYAANGRQRTAQLIAGAIIK